MYIKSIHIKNFKCFKDTTINFDPNFNLIIGENNSGKSTVFEALRLWQIAIQQFYKDRTAKSDKNIVFYQNYNYKALDLPDLSFLRIQDVKDILKEDPSDKKTFEIAICFSNDEKEAHIPLSFKTTSKNTLSCRILILDESQKEKELAEISHSLSDVMELGHNATFKNRIRLAYIPPKFTLPNEETLLSKYNAMINEYLVWGKSQLVIRNIMHPWCVCDYRASTKKSDLSKAKCELSQIIDETTFKKNYNSVIKPYIEKVLNYKIRNDVNEKKAPLKKVEKGLEKILNQKFDFVNFKDPSKSPILIIKNVEDKTEISQLGSGTINVLNILSVLEFNNQSIDKAAIRSNILLLDEPDSHLHSNLQKRLFSYLETQSEDSKTQIFIITHNSSLISQFEQVLFIDSSKNELFPIPLDEYLESHLKGMDESLFKITKELKQQKDRTRILDEKIKDIEKTTIVFEGATDRNIFKVAFNKLYESEFPFETIDTVSSASAVTNALNSFNNNTGYLIGIFDHDHAGKTAFNNISKEFIVNDDIYREKDNALGMLLKVPKSRDITFYAKHLTIEYLFENESLERLGVELIQDEGENYKKIKPKENTQAYQIEDKQKNIISTECENLESEAFENFKPIFEKIFEFTQYSHST